MLLLRILPAAGRFHATPWGRHVNEGAVEWPPSPWRFLRALVATWHLKAKTDLAEPLVRQLVDTLAAQLPVFWLPRATLGHTRHYMPVIESKKTESKLVYDAFIHADGPLIIAWDMELPSELREALALLCGRLTYFGRAESVVEARVLTNLPGFEPNARPLPENEPVPEGTELVRVLCPETPQNYARWLELHAHARSAQASKSKGRSRKSKTSGPPIPGSLYDALQTDTGDLQQAGWTLPPGSRWVDYVRPARCFEPAPIRATRISRALPTVARFSLASAVPPRLTRAVSVAERIHQSLVKYSEQAPVFSGKQEGQPLEGHQHAFILCEANGRRDAITHVTVFAPMGFDGRARRALEILTRHGVWGHGGHDIQLVLLGLGGPDLFPDCKLFGPARVWRSLTPFVATRHPKTHRDGRPKLDADGWWIGSPAHDLRRLLAELGKPMPTRIEPLETIPVGSRRLRPLEFQTERLHGEGRRGARTGTAFQLVFPEPVTGPLALGYGAHFGLGLFIPLQ
ncbi:MAG: type I-U CRISPR-associated protein Csb2 [Limisphaera sp.]